MKKNYFLLLVSMLFGLGSFAQLSGTYTINGATATGGTNYQTFQAAISALNTSGVSGPVTFNVAAGTYTGEVLLTSITGTSATNTVTFDGGTAGATLTNNTGLSTQGTIRFLNTSDITFKNLNVTTTGYGRVVYFDASNDNITFKKCNVSTKTNNSTANTPFYNESGTGNLTSNLTIDSCVISYGYYGAGYFYGGSTTIWEQNFVFTNNTCQDFWSYGAYFYYQENALIKNNTWTQNPLATGTSYGPYFRMKSSEFSHNKITLVGTGTNYGLTPYYCEGTATSPTKVYNNMVATAQNSTGAVYGARVYNCKFTDIQHNTISNGTTSGTTYGFYHIGSSTYGPNNIQNNIITTNGGGSNNYIGYFGSSGAAINTLDNNIYYTYGSSSNQFYWGGARSNFTAFQTASSSEANGIYGDAQYISPTDLHLQGTIANGAAAVIAGITTDIDGDARTATPDIGADEYTPPSCPSPTALARMQKSATSHDLNWTAGIADVSWMLEYGTPGFTPGTGTSFAASNDTTTLTGLTPQTSYDVYVRGICGANDTSIYVGPLSISTGCSAGLSGMYTLNPSAAASATNFVDFASLFTTLESCGVSGPTTVNVAAGSGPHIMNWDLNAYNPAVAPNGVTGLSSTNTLTLNGNGVTVNRGAGTYFLALDAISYLTINDFNFTNERLTTNVFGIMLRGGCDEVTIKNNTIDLGTSLTSSSSCGIVATNSLSSYSMYGDNANNVTIDSNTIIGGYVGVRLNGIAANVNNTGNVISNNIIKDYYYYGVYNYYQNDLTINNNDFSRPTRSSITTFYGVHVYYSTQVIIANNKIHNPGNGSFTAYPLYFGRSNNTVGSESYIVNNAIYDIGDNGTSTFYGMYFLNAIPNTKIYHNTVQKNTDGTTGIHRGMYFSSAPNNVELRNNLVSITGSGTGTKYCYYSSSSSTFTGSNNLFHMDATAGTNNTAYWSGNQATIADWNTASSTTGNSGANPAIVAGLYTPLSITTDNGGASLPIVPTDIDGAARSATTPDFGAVEFTGIPGDMSIQNAWLQEADVCFGTTDSAYATIKNDFGPTVNFATNPLTVNWTTTGPIADAGSTTITSGTLATGATMDVYISSIDMTQGGTYTVSANISANAVNANALNDTLTNHSTFDKDHMIILDPEFDTLHYSSDSVTIKAKSPFLAGGGGAFFFTEISQFQPTTGQPTWSPAPSYWSNNDYLEITGIPGSDLAGYTLEMWAISGTTPTRSYTFATGTVLSSNGTAIIAHDYSTASSSPANAYYGVSGSTYTSSSGTETGRILRDPSGNIVDAVGYTGDLGTYTFPAAAGVTAADWTNPIAGSASGTWGIRLEGADLNNGSTWVQSSTSPQDPNTLNNNVILPTLTPNPKVTWTNLTTSTVLPDTTFDIKVGNFTVNGTYAFEAALNGPCGLYKDTSYITFLQQTKDTVAPVVVCDSYTTPLGGNVVTASGYPTDTIFGVNPVYDSIIVYYPLTVNVKTFETLVVSICDSFVSPSGKSLKASGAYMDTLINAAGCDSIITINLTITTTTFVRQSVFACDSYVWRGMTFTTPGTTNDTVLTGSCDSIYVLTLSMGYTSSATFTQFVCDSLVSPSGKVWKSSGTFMDTITNASGCDSVMTFNLTFGYTSYNTINTTQCDSYTSPSGKVWTTSGTYMDTIPNASGCNNVLTINLTVNYSNSRTDNASICPGQTYRVGTSIYSASGTYTNVFKTSLRCDSTVITNLTVWAPSVNTINYNFCEGDSVQINGNWYYAATTFTQTLSGASSHGCDSVITHNVTTRTVTPRLNLGPDVVACVDGGARIIAPTGYDTYLWAPTGLTTNTLSLTGAASGVSSTTYSLTVSQASSGCSATDEVTVTFNNCVGLNEVEADLNVNLYPNPATSFVTIEIIDKNNSDNLKLEILNSLGQVVYTQNVTDASQKVMLDVNNFSKGIYLVRISSDNLYMTKKLLIQK